MKILISEIVNSKDKQKREKYVNYLFKKLQRKEGLLERDCDRIIRNDRVIWASCMVSLVEMLMVL